MSAPPEKVDLNILYAGSLESLLVEDLFPRFQRLTGYCCGGCGGGSRQWAAQLRKGKIKADLLLSADAAVNEMELMRQGEEVAEWYLLFAANELVLAYSDTSTAAAEIETAARQEGGWLRLLQGGYRLGRPDPDTDPKGYRTLFALQLAEKYFGPAGLFDIVIGSPRNPAQIFDPAELPEMLRRGEIDIAFSYRSQAQEAELPFVKLPAEINLGSPDFAEKYAEASHICTDGTRYCGSPIAYTAAPLTCAEHPVAAAAFLVFLTSEEAVASIQQHGFQATNTVKRPRDNRSLH